MQNWKEGEGFCKFFGKIHSFFKFFEKSFQLENLMQLI